MDRSNKIRLAQGRLHFINIHLKSGFSWPHSAGQTTEMLKNQALIKNKSAGQMLADTQFAPIEGQCLIQGLFVWWGSSESPSTASLSITIMH